MTSLLARIRRSLTTAAAAAATTPATTTTTATAVATLQQAKDVFHADKISGVPPEITRRMVRIYRPANTPTQSGSARPNPWKVDFDTKDRWENPLMGWASSGDPVQSLSIKFSTKEDAILFAERQGYDYWIDAPKEGKFTPKVYANNFKYSAGKLRLHHTK